MSENLSSSIEPTYLYRLGLSKLPFSPVKDENTFFRGVQIGQLQHLILHLLRSTQQPIQLTAKSGVGKTTLLKKISREKLADLRFCWVSEGTNPKSLLTLISSVLVATSEPMHGEAFQNTELKNLLRQLQRNNVTLALIVDDADKLDDDLISEILRLVDESVDGKKLIQAIFASEMGISQLSKQAFEPHSVTLPELEYEEISAYLMYRLEDAGYVGELPFSKSVIQSFYKQTGGNIAELNHLAHQSLLRAKKPQSWPKLPKFPFKFLQLVAGILACFVILGILIFQGDINSWIDSNSVEKAQIEHIDYDKENEVVSVQAISEAENESMVASPANELGALLAELDSELNEQVQTVNHFDKTLESVQINTDEDTSAQVDGSDDGEELDAVAEGVEENKDVEVIRLDEGWVIEQPPTFYTYQMMGAWTQEEVDEYIEKYALSGKVAQFTSLRNGKPWHVLLYGVYKSKQSAVSESKNWPPPMSSLPTWLRRFDSVQKQIKDSHPVQ